MLKIYDIEHELKKIKPYPQSQTIKCTKFFPSYNILQENIHIKNNNYEVFKITKGNEINYYLNDNNIYLGRGCNGEAWQGINLKTQDNIVIKYGYIGIHEVTCLIKTGLYIAHIDRIILIKKAPGISYGIFLMNSIISDNKKIILHKKIIDKLIELGETHNIYHGDIKPEHIFIENDKITLIDFGSSKLQKCIRDDIDNLNKNTLMYCSQNTLLRGYIKSIKNKSLIKRWIRSHKSQPLINLSMQSLKYQPKKFSKSNILILTIESLTIILSVCFIVYYTFF